MTGDKEIQAIIDRIDKAVTDFQAAVPNIQKDLFREVQSRIQKLEIKDGSILGKVANLKILSEIEAKLERIVLTPEYKEAVKKYIDTFSEIEKLQQKYFAAFNYKFKPSKTIGIIRSIAVQKTVNGLMSQGLQVNVLSRVSEILNSNITTGGSYADLNDQLRNSLLTNETGEGSLERYTKIITTDAVNQYSAQYHEALAQDLDFNWGRYVGSNIKTSRAFCLALTKKEWVHKSELTQVVKGNFQEFKDIDGRIYPKTNLPSGMIAGTNETNFKVRRGGYSCGHQFFWVADSAVPAHIKARFSEGDKSKKKPAGVPVSGQFSNIKAPVKLVVSNALEAIDKVHGDGSLENIPIEAMSARSRSEGAFYRSLSGKPLKIEVKKNGDHPELTFAHELGHYMDLHTIGSPGAFDTGSSTGMTKPLLEALEKTDSIKKLRGYLKKSTITILGKEVRMSSVYRSHLKYLLSPHEMFARAYAQFVATRSGGKMLDQLKGMQKRGEEIGVPYQFSDEEFTAIDKEMEKLFVSNGWISQ